MNRRIGVSAALCLFCAMSSLALAQSTYPNRPIKLIVGFLPGGATDIAARAVAEMMSVKLGQAIVVENRPGASASIAAVAVARAPADGYTLLFGSSTSFTINPALRSDLGYDPLKSFTHLGYVTNMDLVFVTSKSAPLTSLSDLIAQSKAQPSKFFYGSSAGTGSLLHFATEKLKYDTGIEMEHVPFNGSSSSLTALMGGQVQLLADTMVASMPLISAGKIRAIAVMSEKRLPQLPEVPTVSEAVPGFTFSTFFTLEGPAGMPVATKHKLESTLAEVANSPQFKRKLIDLHLTPAYGDGTAVEERISRELARNRAVAARANIRAE